ncbi:BglG family transcription antiterminator [Anaerobranca gottschalkii]|uniref:Transcriptional antiterminator n=1 Tax=Anaerobranca gottschalkii DSM 13577 TaxID=1120990 RepID=A0A1I0CE15_9FIRM|nr:BglG family transcription antiterminator [Anaerobranca gottschalkii]SET17818.1 Transcriptional antiterminator [Anaerobranca gottschalkii DSM 13577]
MNVRLKKMLEILLNSRDYKRVDQLSKILNVSNRTIRSDLDKLERIVELEGIYLVRKPGVGVKIDGTERNIQLLSRKIREDLNLLDCNSFFSPEQRKKYIIKKLFLSKNQVTVNTLSEELFVSKNTIYNDLDNIEKLLQKQNLYLIKDRGIIRIAGKEKDYRKVMSHYMSELDELNFHKGKEFLYETYKGRIDSNTLFQLKQIVDINYNFLEKTLDEVEKELNFKFPEGAFINLLIHIAITIRRIKEGYDIFMPDNIFNNIVKTNEFKFAKKMVKKLEEEFNMIIPETEIGYITLHILGSKMYRDNLLNFHSDFKELGDLGLPVEMAKEIAKIVSNALNINLTEDERFLSGLVIHLKPTINRLKYGLTIKNPILNDIKKNYPQIYGVSWMTSVVFEKYLGLNIPESEIGYIAMHIGAAVERNSKKIKVMVVCHTGIGTSQFLYERLKKSFPELELVGICSSTIIQDKELSDIDLIISTVPVRTTKPNILISPILSYKDIKLLMKFIEEYYNKGDNQKSLDKEVFFNVNNLQKKEEILRDMCVKLEKRDYITKDFVNTLIQREKISSTEIGKGLVIPHGLPKEVKKSCIGLTVLDKYVRWNEEDVKYILIICLTEEEINRGKRIFKNLSELLEEDEFFSMLEKCPKSAKQALELLER